MLPLWWVTSLEIPPPVLNTFPLSSSTYVVGDCLETTERSVRLLINIDESLNHLKKSTSAALAIAFRNL